MTKEDILELYSDDTLVFADGLDDAIIGIEAKSKRICYSLKKIIEILMKDSMDYVEAVEYYCFNIEDAYVGEQSPIFVDDDF